MQNLAYIEQINAHYQWRNSRGAGTQHGSMGQSAPLDTSHREIPADLPGKERKGKK